LIDNVIFFAAQAFRPLNQQCSSKTIQQIKYCCLAPQWRRWLFAHCLDCGTVETFHSKWERVRERMLSQLYWHCRCLPAPPNK